MERLRDAFLAAPEAGARGAAAAAYHARALETVPYVPLGQFFSPTALRTDLDGMLKGIALFYGIKRT